MLYRDFLCRIAVVVALPLAALFLFNCTEAVNVLQPYYHDEVSDRDLPQVSFTSNDDEYAHVVTNNSSSPVTYTVPIDTSTSPAWRLYFVLSNGRSIITKVPKVSAISLPPNSQSGENINVSILERDRYALSARGHSDQLPPVDEHSLIEHFDSEKYELSELPPLYSAPSGPSGAQEAPAPDPLLSIRAGDRRRLFSLQENRYYNATARLVRDVTVDIGSQKRLIIWTADNVYSGCTENCLRALLDQSDLTAMADIFLQEGNDNDIYDWTTELAGPEWGPHDKDNLITANSATINIFFLDIREDRRYNGGILGYYARGNNFKSSGQLSIPWSNEMLLFYIDAPHAKYLSSNTEQTDMLRPRWRHIVYSVLAHEFQHMINYYQRAVLLNTRGDPAWLNEMLSMMAEDIISQRLLNAYGYDEAIAAGLRDNRGLATKGSGSYPTCGGRLVRYAETSYWGISRWDSDLLNYATNFAFGSYLLRNYPVSGSNDAFFKQVYQSSYQDMQSLLETAQQSDNTLTEDELIARWGVAVLLSDSSTASQYYRYNFGNSGLVNRDITLGSINLYNYARCQRDGAMPAPALHVFRNTRDIYYRRRGEQFGHSFFILAAAQNVQGRATFKVTLPPSGSLTAVAKRQITTGPSFFPTIGSGR